MSQQRTPPSTPPSTRQPGAPRERRVIVAFAAHPDDELLGAGATFAKRLADGYEVHAVVVCEGASVRYGSDDGDQQAQARRAAGVLGFTSFRCLMLADQRLDTVPQLELNRRLEAVLDELEPSVVYTHWPGDINRDHELVHDSVMVATRPGRTTVREVYGFEAASATGLWTKHAFRPDTFEVVDGTLERKLEAMACYLRECPPFPHPRSVESLRHRARYWGSFAHAAAAEPFVTLRRIVR